MDIQHLIFFVVVITFFGACIFVPAPRNPIPVWGRGVFAAVALILCLYFLAQHMGMPVHR